MFDGMSGGFSRAIAMSGFLAIGIFGCSAGSSQDLVMNVAPCHQGAGSWVAGGPWDTKQFGKYFISNDNFNGTPNQKTWADSERCFGVTTTSTTERSTVGSYPHIVRGWMQNDADMRSGSSKGTLDWTTKSGLGIPASNVSRAKIHWAFAASAEPGARWNALIDVYFHHSASPAPSEFPPALDLQIMQSIADQVIGKSTYYAYVAGRDHATTVTLGGSKYLIFVDDDGGKSFHQSGGHTIALFNLPTSLTSDNNQPIWGVHDGVTDLAAIISYLMRPNPVDDGGRPLLNAAGAVISSPLISPDLFLTAINAGWEIDVGTAFTTTAFCVSVGSEPDCR